MNRQDDSIATKCPHCSKQTAADERYCSSCHKVINPTMPDPDLPNVPLACWGCTRDTMGDGDVCAECNPYAL